MRLRRIQVTQDLLHGAFFHGLAVGRPLMLGGVQIGLLLQNVLAVVQKLTADGRKNRVEPR